MSRRSTIKSEYDIILGKVYEEYEQIKELNNRKEASVKFNLN